MFFHHAFFVGFCRCGPAAITSRHFCKCTNKTTISFGLQYFIFHWTAHKNRRNDRKGTKKAAHPPHHTPQRNSIMSSATTAQQRPPPPPPMTNLQKFRTSLVPVKYFDYPIDGDTLTHRSKYSNLDVKLERGPCKQEFQALSQCAKSIRPPKTITSEHHDHAPGLCRYDMEVCPDDARKIVGCIAKHEGYFLNM